MSLRGRVHPALAGLCLALAGTAGSGALAQEAPPDTPASAMPAAQGESPKPRPKRRPVPPRPAAKASAPEGMPAEPRTAIPTAAAPVDQGQAGPVGAGRPAAPPARAPKAAASKAVAPRTAAPGPLPVRAPAAAPLAPAAGGPVPPPAPPGQVPAQPPPPVAAPPPPVAAAEPPSPCGARAALYDGEKGFSAFVTRLGRAEVENPLRPLTPEVTRVLQITIAGKVATAYGPDLTALRRGGSPAVLESQLGGGIRWEPALPLLPETLTVVSETGETLARLAFRACTEAPAVKAPPAEARAKGSTKDRRPGARRPAAAGEAAGAAPRTPPGFRLPQGAIAE